MNILPVFAALIVGAIAVGKAATALVVVLSAIATYLVVNILIGSFLAIPR